MKYLLICGALTACASTGAAFEKYVLERYGTPDHGWQRATGVIIDNPVPRDAGSLEQGETLFRSYCQPCHGPMGRGDGPHAEGRQPRPADLLSLKDQSDYHLYLQVSLGRQGMPSRAEDLSERDRWDIVNFIKSRRSGNQ